jgi:hypothetical protein
MPPSGRVTKSQILELMNTYNLTPTQVARALGCSRQLVNYHLKHAPGPEWASPATVARESLESVVDIQNDLHKKDPPYRRLADHAEYMATGGRGMSHDQLYRLSTWYRRMTTHVLVYDPSIPPGDGFRYGGWSYERREDRDGTAMIRVNEWISYDDRALEVFRVPAQELWPDVEK